MSICGIDCETCSWHDKCAGCAATCGKPFGGACILAECCHGKGFENCEKCTVKPCGLKMHLIAEFNALNLPDMPEVTELNALPGSFINMEYVLDNGSKIKFFDDSKIYLGNQLEKQDGSGRCYGLVADEKYIMVCEYGCNGADPEIVAYKRW